MLAQGTVFFVPGFRQFLCAIACLSTGAAIGYEEVLTPYENEAGLQAPFTLTHIDPFEPHQRWGSWPIKNYGEVLERTAFIYHYYRLFGFSDEEIERLQASDRAAHSGTFAYVQSREARAEKLRGVLRVASTRPMRMFFAPVAQDAPTTLLPVELKYPWIQEYIAKTYPRRVELGRFASAESTYYRRVRSLTLLLRATGLFLAEFEREGTIIIEATDYTRHLYELYGFKVDTAVQLPEGRMLMTVTVEYLLELLVGRIERARYLTTPHVFDHAGVVELVGNMDKAEASLPRVLRPHLGALDYYRGFALATSGHGQEALRYLENLLQQYGDEPELESLEVHIRALAAMDPWTGTGDIDGFLHWVRSPDARTRIRPQDFERFTDWDDRLYWEAMAKLSQGDFEATRALRDALVLGHYSALPQGKRVLDLLGVAQAGRIQDTVEPTHHDRVLHARFDYQTTPLGLSPSYNRYCAGLLEADAQPEQAALLRQRAEALDQ